MRRLLTLLLPVTLVFALLAPVSAQVPLSKVSGLINGLSRGKSLYVDATRGSNTTGTRGRSDKPYLTIAAAKAAAQSGDTIYVRPGTYNERNLLKNGVDIYGPNADIVYTGAAAGGIFDDSATNGANGACTANITLRNIRLNSAQTGSPSGNNGAVNIENASSNVYVECMDISAAINNGTSAQRCAIYCEAGTLTVRAKRQIANTYYDAIIIGKDAQTPDVDIECANIYTHPTTGGDGVEWASGNLRVRCNRISSGGACVNSVYLGSGSFYVMIDAQEMLGNGLAIEGDFPDTDFFIRSTLIRSSTSVAADISSGSPEVIGATIRGGTNSAAVNLTVGNIKLRDCKLIKSGSATNAITGSGTLYVYGSLDVNAGKAVGITIGNGAYPSTGSSVT